MDRKQHGGQCPLPARGLPGCHTGARPGEGVHWQAPGEWVSTYGARSGSAQKSKIGLPF